MRVIPAFPSGDARASSATHVAEEKLLQMYTATKGWRTRKLETTRHMIQKIGISFDLTSYNEIKKEMATLEKQITTLRDVADQLIIIKSDVGKDQYEESIRFKQEFQ